MTTRLCTPCSLMCLSSAIGREAWGVGQLPRTPCKRTRRIGIPICLSSRKGGVARSAFSALLRIKSFLCIFSLALVINLYSTVHSCNKSPGTPVKFHHVNRFTQLKCNWECMEDGRGGRGDLGSCFLEQRFLWWLGARVGAWAWWGLWVGRVQKMNYGLTACVEEWDAVKQDKIDELIRTMPQRIQSVIQAEGGHTMW